MKGVSTGELVSTKVATKCPMNRWLSTMSTECPTFFFFFSEMVILLLYTIKVKKNKIIKKIVKNHDTHDTHDTQPAIHRAFLEYSTFF